MPRVSAILYPIAADALSALSAPIGRAARQSDALKLAGEPVSFVREFVGPTFKTEEAALDAHAGRLDDPRPDARAAIAPQDRFCDLRPVAQRSRVPFVAVQTVWRLSVGYWRIGVAKTAPGDLAQARQTRRDAKGAVPDGDTLDALAQQPLRPILPQKALDFGLFDIAMPEDPGRMMPDE
jgi:hypothetical protein